MAQKNSNNLRSIYPIRLIFQIFHILDHIYKIYEFKLNLRHWFTRVSVFIWNASSKKEVQLFPPSLGPLSPQQIYNSSPLQDGIDPFHSHRYSGQSCHLSFPPKFGEGISFPEGIWEEIWKGILGRIFFSTIIR